ncbi:uncharacterized protein EI90DRAFT_3051730 [Cantharellus anzutake]|uniref:uncharacterized protein n=1 Tax=Cantharellus anzutake TaxID=1750568 RepID=UPI00190421E2|nr:uncharacterized protein EI90DRAFT_3051730 [Cantharellus anzutake]KAF8334299.1 hypothetical protein EI90DRAFT_3051730 [Cantharellus anzutake]
MLQDPQLAAGQTCERTSTRRFADTLESRGNLIAEYGRKWIVKEHEGHIRIKVEELSWLVALLFGLGGWREGHNFARTFSYALCHFIPVRGTFAGSSVPPFKGPVTQDALPMRPRVLGFSRRPQIPIKAYYRDVTTNPKPSSRTPRPIPNKKALSSDYDQNPWLRIIQSVLHHPDEHLLKSIRALAHYSSLYGDKSAGDVRPIRDGKRVNTGLEGDDVLDGTLFVRVAGEYDRQGLGWDEVWK